MLGVGGVLVATVRLVGPAWAPPLYDGILYEDPYRYLTPPPGERGHPEAVTATLRLRHGRAGAVSVATGENPPQAQISAASGAVAAPAGFTGSTLTLTIKAVPPPSSSPPKGSRIEGNVYAIIAATPAGAAASVAPGAGHEPTITLRGPPDATDAVLERFTGTGWARLETQGTNSPDIYMAPAPRLGDFALVGPLHPPQSSLAGPIIGIVAAIVLLVGGLVLTLRKKRQ